MSIEHLTDYQIQEYLTKKSEAQNIDLQNHLNECKQCRSLVKQYQYLFVELKQEKDVSLLHSFADTTMSKIKELENANKGFNIRHLLLYVLGIVTCIGVAYYFTDFKDMVEGVRILLIEKVLYNSAMISSIKGIINKYEDVLVILIFASLILVFVAIADRILIKHKPRKVYFLSI